MKLCRTAIAKKMILMISAYTLLIIIAGAAYYRSSEIFPFTLGVILTSALNVLKVTMIEREADRVANREVKNARSFGGFQYIFRFLLTGVVLVMATMVPFINFWGAVAGIFTLQIAAYSMKFFYNADES